MFVIRQYHCLPTALAEPLPNSAVSWDAMRLTQADTPFSIPASPEEWKAKAGRKTDVVPGAAPIIEIAKRYGCTSIVSHGAGAAWLEYHIKHLAPSMNVTICDVAPDALNRIRLVFLNCDSVVRFDLLHDIWSLPIDATLHLMHRIETEFSPEQWRRVFNRLAEAGVSKILFVPSELIGWREAVAHKIRWMKDVLRGRDPAFCGWLYSESALQSLWKRRYSLAAIELIGELRGYLLTLHWNSPPRPKNG